MKRTTLAFVAALTVPAAGHAQTLQCTVAQQEVFPGDNERVRLGRATGLGGSANIAVYRAPLAVNTDGAPTSYHPDDFLGQTLAINRIDNGITIRRTSGTGLETSEKIEVFNRWKSSGWTVPSGYTISWQNVIAARQGKPCVLTGENRGYFGSLTALKNGLPAAQAGECQVRNQLDQRYIPAIVLRGGSANPLTTFGAKVGDLVVAVNPATGRVVPAIVGDSGDGKRIGEGSVALNMALLGVSTQPSSYQKAKELDTGSSAMVVAVIPGSRTFQRVRPYSAQNIAARVEAWAAQQGYGSTATLARATLACAEGL
ncbi:MAG TPA: hypothetical protein VEA41_18965 [Salinarimonas sp.]|nr:hypothetical protein [Salinarimonas sp.]